MTIRQNLGRPGFRVDLVDVDEVRVGGVGCAGCRTLDGSEGTVLVGGLDQLSFYPSEVVKLPL